MITKRYDDWVRAGRPRSKTGEVEVMLERTVQLLQQDNRSLRMMLQKHSPATMTAYRELETAIRDALLQVEPMAHMGEVHDALGKIFELRRRK